MRGKEGVHVHDVGVSEGRRRCVQTRTSVR